MHHEAMHFMYETKVLYPQYFKNARVLEIGSLKLGLQPSAKSHFENCDYVGVDIDEGPNVDVVCKGHEYTSDELFDIVISCECFEHDPFYDLTVINMLKHLKPTGLFVMTCAGLGRPEHGTSNSNPISSPFTQNIEWWKDFYKNRTPYDFKTIPHWDRLHMGYWGVNEANSDLYYRGFKK
jgi:SAM-dependent methyltransferase